MARTVESFLRLATGRLLWVNLALLVFIKLLLPFGSGGLAAITESLNPFDPTDIVRITNEARRAAGLADLRANPALDAAAARKLDDMAAQQYFAHVTPDGKQPWDFILAAGYRYRSAGENLGKGFNDPSALVNAWMGSPSHRANLVNTGYREIGVAVRRVTLNGVSTLLVVQMFANPQTVVAVKVAPSPVPKLAPAPVAPKVQQVSTERAIPPVQAPTSVTAPASVNGAHVAETFNGVLMAELGLLLGLLSVAAVWTRFHRRALVPWSGAFAVLVLAAVLPALAPMTSGSIF
jgi:hypothetical protein